MSSSPSEVTLSLDELAASVATATVREVTITYGTDNFNVPPEPSEAAQTTHPYYFVKKNYSWLSAVDWSNEVQVGDPLVEPVEERYELIAAVSDLTTGNILLFTTDLPKVSPRIASLVGIYAGANWHEREAHEMFGIDFSGHPNLIKLYLPDGFEGYPLQKSYPLLTREVKPWPGTVDVEGMPGQADTSDEPSEENPEA